MTTLMPYGPRASCALKIMGASGGVTSALEALGPEEQDA